MTTQALPTLLTGKASLAAYWKFDETTGATADDAEASYDGTIAGPPTLGAGSGVDDGGTCFEFTDAEVTPTQYVSVSTNPTLATFAIGALFLPGTELGTDALHIFCQDTSQTTTDALIDFGINASGYPTASIVLADDTTITVTSTTLAVASVWTSLGITWDGTTLTLWQDGASADTATAAAGTPALGGQSGSMYIGCGMNTDGSLVLGAQGRLDHVFVCNASTDFDTAADWAELHQTAFNRYGEVVSDELQMSELRTPVVRRVVSLTDGVEFNDSTTAQVLTVLSDGLVLSDAVAPKLSFNPTVRDVLLFAESVVRRTPITVSDSLLMSEVLRASLGITVDDVTKFSDEVSTTQHATLSDGIVFADQLFRKFSETLSDVVNMSEMLRSKEALVLGDIVAFNETLDMTRKVVCTESDGVEFNEVVNAKQTIHQLLRDGVLLGGTLKLGETEYNAWVVNTINEAPFKFDGYDYNSFAGDLAAKSDGIYRFTADADSGTDIDAYFETGFHDFNTSAKKQFPDVYLYAATDGRLILKVTTSMRGERTTDWYEAEQIHEDEDAIRYKPGKGLKSRYVKFRIQNTEGKDFEVDDMEVRALKLSRRI